MKNMKISEHIKTILSVAVILTIHFIPLSAQDKEKYPAEVQVKLHGLTAVASLDSGFHPAPKAIHPRPYRRGFLVRG